MSRSVARQRNAIAEIFFHFETEDEEAWEWDCVKENLQDSLSQSFPSFWTTEKEWVDNETPLLLANDLVKIGISCYGRIAVVSIIPVDGKENLAFQWVWRTGIKEKIEKLIGYPILSSLGYASNGEQFFRLKTFDN